MKKTRRDFIKKTMLSTAAVSLGGILPGYSAKSYSNIIGANERILVGVMGVNSRGLILAENFAGQKECEVIYISDVDSRASNKCLEKVEKIQTRRPKTAPDFRNALEDKSLDVMVIATPDHWHAPAAILACKAGKHVYLEKPASHNPHEGELIVTAAQKYSRLVQMGNQLRSYPNIIIAIKKLHDGIIGRPYFAKGWYASNRESIGYGKKASVPDWLNYELWQGPAPRRHYKDNLIHYNWHWFWNWGTGEALNNGTHQVDLMRWGLDVEYPERVTSAGGRYRYQDDWETPDTQVITLEFPNNTCIEWEGRSCNKRTIEGKGSGVVFYGETGSMVIGGNDYKIYDLNNQMVEETKNDFIIDPQSRVTPSQGLDSLHIQNLLDGIRKGKNLHSEIKEGHQSTLLCQLGNIALRSGDTLNTNTENGHIIGNNKALRYWSREYEPGWEPTI